MDLWFSAVSLAGVGLLFAALAVPLWKGRVPPNQVYGVRTPAAFRSESNWYHLNRVGGRWLFRIGLALVALGLGLLLWRPAPEVAIGIAIGGPLAGAILLLAVSLAAGRRHP